MSPPSDHVHVPRTPDRRSSTQALFTAFRSLTGSRLKSSTPPPFTSSAACSPARSPSLGALRSSSMASPNSTDSTLRRISQVSQRSTQPITGGPPELESLVSQLDSQNSFPERAAAIDKICAILEQYPVQNVLGLWSMASDLLLPEQPEPVAEAGYKLVKSCVSWPKLTPIERNVFFDAASLRKNDGSFDQRLDIINALTKRGRDVEACESSIVPFIMSSLDLCYKASREAANASRKASSKRNADKPSQQDDNLARLFQYAVDICKFNAKILTDQDLELILARAMDICLDTVHTRDMENCIKLFDTIMTYVHVPAKVLRPCVEVLCTIHRVVESLKEETWSSLTNLFKSHVGGAAILSLLHTLLDGPVRTDRKPYNFYRGTVQVLELLLLDHGRSGLPKVPLPMLCPALKASIKEPHQTQEELVIKLIDTVLAQEELRDMLLFETDIGDLIDIIGTCVERDDDRHRARATGKSTNVDSTHVPSPDNGSTNNVGAPSPSQTPLGRTDDKSGAIKSSISPTPKPNFTRRHANDHIFQILTRLGNASDALDFVQRQTVMGLSLRCAHRLGDAAIEDLIRYFANEGYLNPASSDWLNSCKTIVEHIIQDGSRPRSLRNVAIQALRETYNTVDTLCGSGAALQCGALLLDNIQSEDDVEVLHELVDFAVHVADGATLAEFSNVVGLLKARLDRPRLSTTINSSHRASPSLSSRGESHFGSPSNVITSAFVQLFTRSVTNAARKTLILYETLRAIAGNDNYENDARLTALKLLFRLRANARHALTVSICAEGERIAAELCRTEETAILPSAVDEVLPNDPSKSEESSWRDQRKASGSSPHSSLNRHTGRSTVGPGRMSKSAPPLWMYPGPAGLPEEPSPDPSRAVFSHIDASRYPLSDDVLDMEITLWLELIISLLQRPPDWEIYSYVLVHLGPQLSNQALVRSCVVQLRMLRNVLCEQVRNSSFHEPPPHTLLKRADVAVCLFHVLTVILSYHEYFEKSEEDDLVKSFLQGIVQWDRTSKWCIHALSVCCFELPLSVSKSLDAIIQKMSQIITKPAIAIHILEFLTSLARLPDLYKNFREDEFKLVFGVCFRYLQHIRDQRDRAAQSSLNQARHQPGRHSGVSRDSVVSSDHSAKKLKTVEEDLPQYLYSLAYHVITFWFMALKMEDRPKQIPWITRNLYYADNLGRQIMEEQGQVILDIMNMVAYTDRDQTVRDENFARPGDGEVWRKTWVVGNSLVSIETAARTGSSLVTTRRPCGTRFLAIRPLLAPPPHHQVPITVGLASEAFYSDSYVGVLPEDIFQSFYSPLDLSNPPVPLPDDEMTRRAITLFDKIATVDSYKVGVIYIAEGQTKERDIFMNSIGSPAYTSFVSDLGTLCRLKDATFNTGGLDTHNNADGEFTYCWRDRCMELVFHITTMMPTNPDDDMTYPNKKKHIGNDFVNIIFNDSGLPYNFDTFPSAFNYVHIVISPESRASFVDRRLDADPNGRNRYYKVQAISRADFPDISPAVETKILCGKHLAGYCRLIAINACVFSSVWYTREHGESVSSWRGRLREIKRLRDRYGGGIGDYAAAASSPSSATSPSQPPSREHNGISPFQRISIATHVTDSRSSVSSSSHDL
ncbi:tuberin [Phaeosphaeriaceae sp. PMI808]|nr:tuberin [Phaeosphaeriaceae sp. PMI808]